MPVPCLCHDRIKSRKQPRIPDTYDISEEVSRSKHRPQAAHVEQSISVRRPPLKPHLYFLRARVWFPSLSR